MWIDHLDPSQFEEISNEMKSLHKSMKNMIEIVFATSPLLALSTQGWASKSISGTYLLRVRDVLVFFGDLSMINEIFAALGNDRPKILIELEDHVLQAIIGISEGISIEGAMDNLYAQILSRQEDLANDDVALTWFNLGCDGLAIPSTTQPLDIPSTPFLETSNVIKDKFQG